MALGIGGGADLGGGIGGAIGGAIGAFTSGDGGEDELREIAKLWKTLELSNWDARALSAPQLRFLESAAPELYRAVVPDSVEQAGASVPGRNAQLAAVGGLEQIAQEGLPLVDRLNRAESSRAVMDAQANAQDAALRQLAAKGAIGGGDEVQAAILAGQSSANLARDLGADTARDSALRRLAGLEGLGAQGGALRSADENLAAQNAEAINRYRTAWAQMSNDAAARNAAAQTAANFTNTARRQQVGDTNELNRYETELENLNRGNALKAATFGQQVTKLTGQTDALSQLARAKYAEQAARRQNAQAIGQGIGSTAGAATGSFF